MPRPPRPRPAPGSLTPWAAVLTDYAWNRRAPHEPPRTPGQIAARLGQKRPTVASWFRDITPPIETVFAVMVALNIPLVRLADAYREAGLPFPPFTEADASAVTAVTATGAQGARGQAPARTRAQAPAPAPADPPRAAPAPDALTDATINATAASLRDAGLPEDVVTATIARLRLRQHDAPAPHDPPHERAAQRSPQRPANATKPSSRVVRDDSATSTSPATHSPDRR